MILHLDLSTGASGDKMFGALLELSEELGVCSLEEVAVKAQALLPEVSVARMPVTTGGVLGTHMVVNYHDHPIEELGLTSHDSAAHSHRHWSDIKALIAEAAERDLVSKAVADRALRVFTRVATAEAKVHGVELNKVHFHEVGAADSIIDILFNSYLLECLRPTAVYATPLALGNGTFICAHGELPVPAPATAEILMNSNVPVYASSHQGELTTPTGSALVAEFVTQFAPLPCSRPLAVGYGAGTRTVEGAANVLRVIAAEPAVLSGVEAQETAGLMVEGVTLLSCNLDHLSAESLAFACEELLSEGALDVWQESITMKKGRLATKLEVLVKPDEASRLSRRIIELTGSLGVRAQYLERTVIKREVITLETPYGPMPFKAAELGVPSERRHWIRPEHDAVAALARKRAVSYNELYEELQALAEAALQKSG